jgi:acyl phosphate:glycerol-3-phosphate acyltransferase
MTKNIILLVLAFVLGSIPFGIITAKVKGVDLKKVGSGNIGATNVLRSLGKWPAILTLLGDILKGTLAVAIGKYSGVEPLYEGLIGMSAILGHNFSIFLGFRGGKGVATSLGVLFIYIPHVAVITLLIWIVVVLITKYSSLGAIVSFALLPLNVLLTNFQDKTKLFISVLISFFILIRHQENIKRLIAGTERKIGHRE